MDGHPKTSSSRREGLAIRADVRNADPVSATIMKEELGKIVSLKGPKGPIRLPLSQAIVRRALVDAASGKHRAAVARGLRLLERYGPTEDEQPWNLSVLDDEELEALEKLITKISVTEGPDEDGGSEGL